MVRQVELTVIRLVSSVPLFTLDLITEPGFVNTMYAFLTFISVYLDFITFSLLRFNLFHLCIKSRLIMSEDTKECAPQAVASIDEEVDLPKSS